MAEPEAPPDAFAAFIKGFRSLWSLALAGPVLLPFAAAFSGVSPPWPPNVLAITTVTVFVCLILLFSTGARGGNRNARLAAWAVGFFVCLLAYLALFGLFTTTVPTTGERIVLGCGYTRNAALVARSFGLDASAGCPGEFENMLQGAQWNATEIWDRRSVLALSLALFLLWECFFVALSLFSGLFVLGRMREVGGARGGG